MWLDVRYTPRPFKYETNIKEKNKININYNEDSKSYLFYCW